MSSNPWDTRYATGEYYYGTEPNDFLREQAVKIGAGGRVLCLAEGEGRNAVYLAGLGHEVLAVDGSSVGLEKMHRLAVERGVRVQSVVSDLANFVIETGHWDAIVSIWCHVPQPLRTRLHQSVVTGLKPGGLLILEAYHPRQLEFKTGGPPDAALMMTVQALREELHGLDLDFAVERERDIHEGKGHFGRSAVVQVLGVKRT